MYFKKSLKNLEGTRFVVVAVKLNFNAMLCDYTLPYSRPSRFERNFVQVAEADQNFRDVTLMSSTVRLNTTLIFSDKTFIE